MRTPPTIGPTATPSPETPAQIPIALARSWPVNVLVRIDSVVGKMNAAPTPMSARQAMSIAGESAVVARSENAPNHTRPNVSARLRPNLSPRAPAVSSRQANTMTYASTIHCRSEPVAPRSRTIVGSATLRIELSTEITSSDVHSTPSVYQRRSYAFSAVSISQSPSRSQHLGGGLPAPLVLLTVWLQRLPRRSRHGHTRSRGDQGTHPRRRPARVLREGHRRCPRRRDRGTGQGQQADALLLLRF